MRFAVETWDPSYGSAMESTELELSEETVDIAVEVAPSDWAPIDPPIDAPLPETIWFVDGVRRIDARVWITEDEVVRPGVCATVAAGAVRCSPGLSEVRVAEVSRGVFAAASGAGPIVTRYGTYELFPCADDSAEGLYLGVHRQMTALEARVSADVCDADLVIFDGPLRGRDATCGVGYVKTQHVQYLPPDAQVVLGRLVTGQRSPLFLIGGRFTRYSWYVRLPGQIAQPMSGVIRCEVAGVGTAADAVERADQVTRLLGRFASEAHKDPRAPQNLYPIAGLERELRRRLGDALLMERGLRIAAA